MIHNKSPHRAAILITNKHDRPFDQNLTYSTVQNLVYLCHMDISYDVHYFSLSARILCILTHRVQRGFLKVSIFETILLLFFFEERQIPSFFLDSRFWVFFGQIRLKNGLWFWGRRWNLEKITYRRTNGQITDISWSEVHVYISY